MLVLSRKQKQSIFINDDVVVTVLSVRGKTVRLGIEAPTAVPVQRKELHERMGLARDVAEKAEGALR